MRYEDGLLHRATHHVPGVPEHADQPPGHQGAPAHGRAAHHRGVAAHARAPRFMPGWQRRIAAFFEEDRGSYNG